MQALRAAWTAYRDGWRRVIRAPRLLLALAGLVAAVTAASPAGLPASHPFLLDVFAPLGTALMGGALAAALDASDLSGRLGGETAPWVLWLVIVVAGVVLTGGAMDRYARQRPLDSRAFWGVSGELAFRLLRLSAIGGLLFSVVTGVLVLVLDAIAARALDGQAIDAGYGAEMPAILEAGFGIVYLAAAGVIFAATDSARVRMVVERRRSAIFAFTAGVRFVRRRLALVFVLYGALFATAALAWGVFSAAIWWTDPPAGIVRLLDAAQAASVVVAALVSSAAAVSLFQANLAHATYVAPPPLVWPDAPAVETLGDPPARDIPPAV
jgi:hypothetical protein